MTNALWVRDVGAEQSERNGSVLDVREVGD